MVSSQVLGRSTLAVNGEMCGAVEADEVGEPGLPKAAGLEPSDLLGMRSRRVNACSGWSQSGHSTGVDIELCA